MKQKNTKILDGITKAYHLDNKISLPKDVFNYLNSSNLTAPEYQGIDYFDATIYEGNGTGQRVGDFVPFTDAYTVTHSVMFEDGDSR